MQPEIRLSSTAIDLSSIQNKVLRNTYLMLSLTMIPTVIGAYLGMSINFAFMAQHPILSMLGMLAVMFGMFMAIAANRNNSLGVVLLLATTGLFGLMLGPILQNALHFSNGAQLIAMAAGGTGAIFFTLATIATVTKKDFSFMGKFLMIGLVMLILASLANMFFQVPVASLAISAIAIMIFSGYILYDISQIIHGGETNYIMATLALYLDIYNIFVNLLNLLMALGGERD
ncbi:MAG: Bax inhibitor-1/YccA family protein [Sulfuriferula sp.]